MNTEHEQELLKAARDAVAAAVKKQAPPSVSSADEVLNEHCGCFVTLKNGGMLRGCIGQFVSEKPLIKLVGEMAAASSTKDPRFLAEPIMPDELESLDVEISVLSPLKKTDDPGSLRLGVDGIYIKSGYKNGCFLPQVATETGWTAEEFLTHCCVQKAGLDPGAWQKGDTEVFLFTADVFGAEFAEIPK
jgi:AmmeMemoRadiSam system protein A